MVGGAAAQASFVCGELVDARTLAPRPSQPVAAGPGCSGTGAVCGTHRPRVGIPGSPASGGPDDTPLPTPPHPRRRCSSSGRRSVSVTRRGPPTAPEGRVTARSAGRSGYVAAEPAPRPDEEHDVSERPIVWPGRPRPLGALHDGRGTNFSVFSSTAEAVELCLFGDHDPAPGSGRGDEQVRIELTEVDAHCWHAYLPGVGPGTRYGFRAHGRWAPDEGLWHNPAKLLLDPYAAPHPRRGALGSGVLRLRLRRPRHPPARRQRPARAALGRGEPVLRLGPRPTPGPPDARDGALRAARQGLHGHPPRHRPDACGAPTRGSQNLR